MVRARSNRTWLAALIRQVTLADGPAAPKLADAAAFRRWLGATLEVRGFAHGTPADHLSRLEAEAQTRPLGDFTLLNTTLHLLQIGDALVRGLIPGLPRVHRAHLLLEALAWTVDAPELAATIERLPRSETDAQAGKLAAQLAGRLDDAAPTAGDPLLGHPFHHLLRWAQANLFGAVMWHLVSAHEEPDRGVVLQAQGHAEGMVYAAISAAVALVAADGTVDPEELRLVEALFEAAELDAHEEAMLRAELATPATPAELAAQTRDPVERRFLLRLLYLTAYVNGTLTAPERALLEALGAAFGENAASLQRLEYEAIAAYATYADLNEALSPSRAFQRARARFSKRVEDLITTNAARIWGELRETTELLELLAREASGQGLSVAERERARAQLKDLARAVPALAVFAAPGGSLLLPILAKHLPFDLRPSHFKEDESI